MGISASASVGIAGGFIPGGLTNGGVGAGAPTGKYNILQNGGSAGTGEDNSGPITSLVAHFSGAIATIYFPSGTYRVAQNLAVPANVTLELAAGAVLSVDAGKTLSISGSLVAPVAQQIFVGAGTISLSGGMAPDVYAEWWGAKGDNTADDGPFFSAASAAIAGADGARLVTLARTYFLATGATIAAATMLDNSRGTLRLGASISMGAAARIQGGVVKWDILTAIDAIAVGDDCRVTDVTIIGSGAVGNVGAPLYQRGVVGTTANRVNVRGCRFSQMTVGVWSGPASIDPTPVGWRVVDNDFTNIVGYPGQSEGYGVNMTPSSFAQVSDNRFKTIQRHAIYLAGGAQYNEVISNIIDTVDNTAIVLNTFNTQPETRNNHIALNQITNVTKLGGYAYLSAVGIGVFGNSSYNEIIGNTIDGYQDIGITCAGRDTFSVLCGKGNRVLFNKIFNGGATSDSCIRMDDPDGCSTVGNDIVCPNLGYGIVATNAVALGTRSVFGHNNITCLGNAAVGIRTTLTGLAHEFTANSVVGTTQVVLDTGDSTLFSFPVPIQPGVGFIGVDADVALTSGRDRCIQRHAGVLTAARKVTLNNNGAGAGSTFRIMREGAGAFALNVYDGTGNLLKALTAVGQWADFGWNGAAWEQTAAGTL